MLRMLGIPARVAAGFTPGSLQRRHAASTACATSTPTRGSRSGSPASAGCRSTRRRRAAPGRVAVERRRRVRVRRPTDAGEVQRPDVGGRARHRQRAAATAAASGGIELAASSAWIVARRARSCSRRGRARVPARCAGARPPTRRGVADAQLASSRRALRAARAEPLPAAHDALGSSGGSSARRARRRPRYARLLRAHRFDPRGRPAPSRPAPRRAPRAQPARGCARRLRGLAASRRRPARVGQRCRSAVRAFRRDSKVAVLQLRLVNGHPHRRTSCPASSAAWSCWCSARS